MIRFNRQILVLSLAACLLLVPALASPTTVTHEFQHAHHKAMHHSSPFCSWFCGAGQGIHLAECVYAPTIVFLETLEIESADQTDDADSVFSLSRGPPAPSLSFS